MNLVNAPAGTAADPAELIADAVCATPPSGLLAESGDQTCPAGNESFLEGVQMVDGNVVPIRASAALASALNPATVDDQRREILYLRGECARLAASLMESEWKRQFQTPRLELSASLRAKIVAWFIRDADELVITMAGEKPLLMYAAFEEPAKPVSHRTTHADVFGRFLTVVLFGGGLHEFLRGKCRRESGGCDEWGCEGCGGASTDLTIPGEVANLIGQVRRG